MDNDQLPVLSLASLHGLAVGILVATAHYTSSTCLRHVLRHAMCTRSAVIALLATVVQWQSLPVPG